MSRRRCRPCVVALPSLRLTLPFDPLNCLFPSCWGLQLGWSGLRQVIKKGGVDEVSLARIRALEGENALLSEQLVEGEANITVRPRTADSSFLAWV